MATAAAAKRLSAGGGGCAVCEGCRTAADAESRSTARLVREVRVPGSGVRRSDLCSPLAAVLCCLCHGVALDVAVDAVGGRNTCW